ncbi:MAG: TIGR02996 domain-containing protein [Deltaproteobacteria bacterium]|nr:TIGR02996 domain-containing protein [Deltaproteobacteria bacterium]
MATEADLIAQIVDDPDDREAFVVYGDHLSERGDPRGELIALHAPGRDADAGVLDRLRDVTARAGARRAPRQAPRRRRTHRPRSADHRARWRRSGHPSWTDTSWWPGYRSAHPRNPR